MALGRHGHDDPPPDHGGIRVRLQGEFDDLPALPFPLKAEARLVILGQPRLLDQIVVGEMAAHPGTHHHAGGEADGAVGFGKIGVHGVAGFQAGGILFLERGDDADQGFVLALGPHLHAHGPGVVGGFHLHAHRALGAGGAPEVVDLQENGAGLLFFKRWGGWGGWGGGNGSGQAKQDGANNQQTRKDAKRKVRPVHNRVPV